MGNRQANIGGGYTAFTFEITDLLNFGEKNNIWVRVNNAPQLDIMPLVGDLNMYGGIYRDVELMVENPNCISPIHYGSEGISLRQKSVTSERAEVEAEVRLSGIPLKKLKTEIEVLNGNKQVLKASGECTLDAAGKGVASIPFAIDHPRLWDGIRDPFMYKVKVTLRDGQQTVDEGETILGLRYFHVDADKGFFLITTAASNQQGDLNRITDLSSFTRPDTPAGDA